MSEYQLPKGWPERIRGAQRDLIKAAGGIERVASLLGRSVGHVGRWNNPGLDDLMPLPVIILLEEDTKVAVFSKLLPLMIHGRELCEPRGSDDTPAEVMGRAADAMESTGNFFGSLMRKLSDGDLTDSELRELDGEASAAERDLAEYREAAARKRSGLRLVREG